MFLTYNSACLFYMKAQSYMYLVIHLRGQLTYMKELLVWLYVSPCHKISRKLTLFNLTASSSIQGLMMFTCSTLYMEHIK